ncbi:limbin isoform X1 [Triplophysa dalaica]|uniref:limbin isoform X1 n=1 Tax=Triplophysa dalaica TaxID=1582913 RepID=UPI0024E035A2|nr:limbin isoform X1 [Triplophysa dalaica]
MCRFLIVSAFLFVARPEDAARVDRSTSDPDQDKDVGKIQCKKETNSGSSQVRISYVAPVDSWRNRNTRHTPSQNAVKPAFGLTFHKCAQVETGRGSQVSVMLVITNPAEGSDLSQLCIRDAVSDVTLLQTNGSVHETGYQTFQTDSLPAGSEYVVVYRLSVKGNRKQLLTLPAFLTFSNATQNDIHLFGPVVANFTLTILHEAHQDGAVLFLSFTASFLLMVLLLSVSVGIVNVLLHKSTQHRVSLLHYRRSFCEETGPCQGICDITESANQEAAFEDKFVDIMMLEDSQNMIHALDSLNISTRLRSMVVVEHTRVQMYEGLLVVLLRGVGSAGRLSPQAEQRVLGVVHGQIVGMEGKVQEEHVARMETLAARCNLETQEEMESQQRAHASERSHAERLFHQTQHQDAAEVRALSEKLHKEEQRCLQRRLMARHEHASAQAQRQQALRRRFELHKIFGEELQEATITGELQENTADKLLLQYYGCQDSLEEVLDVLLANQRALLAERHAQRRFLVQSFHNLQAVINDTFSGISDRSTQTDGACGVFQQFPDVQSEVLRVKQDLQDSMSRECRAIRCDIIKRRRRLLSEMVFGHRLQLQGLCEVSEITVGQYLQKWTKLLLNQSTELSELIYHLDKQTAASVQQVTVGLLQDSSAQLKAHMSAVCPGAARLLPLTDALHEKLQSLSEADVCDLQSAQSCIQHIKLQELQQQRNIRDAFREYCSCVCASQRSLSHEHWLRVQLECVKAACCLDHCLVLPHDNPTVTLADPAVTSTTSEMQRRSEVMEPKHLQRSMQERMQLLQHTETENDVLQREWSEACVFQEQQTRVCQERVAAFVAALQWEHAEKTAKVTETHSALLKLHTLITQELHNSSDVTQIVHTHCLALEEAELQLQEEESAWEKCLEGRGSAASGDDAFGLDRDRRIADLLQEALYKRQHITQRLTDRVLRRNQTVEYHRDQIQLKRLNTYCQQDLDLSSVLVSQAQITIPDLHEVLRLLLPTVPEGELLSLLDVLQPKAGSDSGACVSLADGLRRDLSRPPHHSDRERDRLIKKRQKLGVKLFSGVSSSEDVPDIQQTLKQVQEFPQTPSFTLQPELQITEEAADEIEEAWPNKEGHISTDPLFIFRCSSPASTHENTQTTRTRRKKQNYLNFKKNSVAPQQQT